MWERGSCSCPGSCRLALRSMWVDGELSTIDVGSTSMMLMAMVYCGVHDIVIEIDQAKTDDATPVGTMITDDKQPVLEASIPSCQHSIQDRVMAAHSGVAGEVVES